MPKKWTPGTPPEPHVITYAHYGDWIAVWHNDTQIHFHDENFSEVLHKIAKAVGFTVEQLDLGPLEDETIEDNQSSIDGPLHEVKEEITKANRELVEHDVAELKKQLREKESELERIKGK